MYIYIYVHYICMYVYIYIYIHNAVVIVRLKQVQLSFECNKIDAFFWTRKFSSQNKWDSLGLLNKCAKWSRMRGFMNHGRKHTDRTKSHIQSFTKFILQSFYFYYNFFPFLAFIYHTYSTLEYRIIRVGGQGGWDFFHILLIGIKIIRG